MRRPTSALVLAIALSVPVAAVAIAGPGDGPNKKEDVQLRLSTGDLATLQHHHDVNLMEIEMGKIALQRGGAGVKKYAAMLVKDHQKADRMAITLAKARGVTLSAGATPMSDLDLAAHDKQMETMDRLRTLRGLDFDREFLDAMVDGHSAELGYLTVAIADAGDAALRASLEKVEPVLEKHADEARDLLKIMNAPIATTVQSVR